MVTNQPTGPSPTAAVVCDQVRHRLPLQRGPGPYFEAMSCNRALSSLSSATSRFRRAFSSCNSFNSRTWSDCSPPNLLPAVERLLGDSRLTHDVGHRHARFRLLAHCHDLFHRTSRPRCGASSASAPDRCWSGTRNTTASWCVAPGLATRGGTCGSSAPLEEAPDHLPHPLTFDAERRAVSEARHDRELLV